VGPRAGNIHQGISELVAGDRGNDVDRGCDFRDARRGRAQKDGVVECRSDGVLDSTITPSLHRSITPSAVAVRSAWL